MSAVEVLMLEMNQADKLWLVGHVAFIGGDQSHPSVDFLPSGMLEMACGMPLPLHERNLGRHCKLA